VFGRFAALGFGLRAEDEAPQQVQHHVAGRDRDRADDRDCRAGAARFDGRFAAERERND
jgi:hypothetical protein